MNCCEVLFVSIGMLAKGTVPAVIERENHMNSPGRHSRAKLNVSGRRDRQKAMPQGKQFRIAICRGWGSKV